MAPREPCVLREFRGYQDIQPEPTSSSTVLNLRAGSRFTRYHFHGHDPAFFRGDLRVLMQCISWRNEEHFVRVLRAAGSGRRPRSRGLERSAFSDARPHDTLGTFMREEDARGGPR